MQKLRAQSLFPMSLVDPQANRPAWTSISLPSRVSKEQVADFCAQLADLLSNGVPMLEGFRILADASNSVGMREAALRMHDCIAEGDSLDVAMAKESSIFSELTLSMVRAGQEGAFLEEALQRTAHFLRKQDEMRSKIIGALIYPILLGVVGTSITAAMVVFLVPKFQPFFDRLEQNGTGLPLITVVLLSLSYVLMHYGIFVLIGLAVIAFGINRLVKTEAGRRIMDKVKLKSPLVGPIFHDAAVSRACRVLGTMLRNGVPLLRSLRISSESTGNVLLSEAMMKSADNVTAGDSLSRPLAASGLIPAQIMAMIRVAEESNTLDEVLVKISDRIDARIERKLDVTVRLIEPLMLILIGGMVLFVIVGVLLPVLELNSSVG